MFYDFRLLEFIPPEDTALAEAELVQGNLVHGAEVERKFPHGFKEYCKQASRLSFKRYSPIEKKSPYILQMIKDIYQQYVFPEIYLDF